MRDTFPYKHSTDLELDDLEAVWIELSVKSKKIGGFYRPPNSDNAYFNLTEESIGRAYNTNIVDMFALRDDSFDMSQNSSNKMTELQKIKKNRNCFVSCKDIRNKFVLEIRKS